ncbi:hypothetical protein [uncultured Erythrobacter sp.]|uniref:hypothetical protein n=1 Tax=uncultured Erythrobacter sp. TaxID=263913 RepID=UPI002657CD6F|nr:hypothetical protein [uncultured Erythrobacter sp.]
MKHRYTFFALVAAAAFSGPVAAQESQAESAATDRTPPIALAPIALANAIAGEPAKRRPLARLRSPLCLAVAAQDEAFARTVAKRIIDNAKAAGVKTRRAGCKPNALVTFSDDAFNQISAYRAEGRKVFRRMSEREIDAALAGRDPAYVFQAVEATPRIMEGDAPWLDSAQNWTKERAYVRTPEDMLSTLVVIEAGAIDGLSPVQIADYASLRLLAPTGELAADDARAPDTILSLFAAPDKAPSEMTRADRAYLTSLYKLPRTAFAAEVLEEAEQVASR